METTLSFSKVCYLLLLPLLFSTFGAILSQSQPPSTPKGFLLNCGATVRLDFHGLTWLPDAPYITSGLPKNLSLPGLIPTLSTLRSFPFTAVPPPRTPRKFCYSIRPVLRGSRYLVRTTYFYGGGGGGSGESAPPVFDQIVDGTFWTVVNTTADYAAGMSSYYEGVFLARGNRMSVCIGGNSYTDSDPFISALEVILLEDSVYNATDFNTTAMGLIARTNFGFSDLALRYPDDRFDRYWQPFTGSIPATSSTQNISVSGFWNLPPAEVLKTAITADPGQPMELGWPQMSLPNSSYYIALYFADTTLGSSRMFSVYINGYNFFSSLMVPSSGITVFSSLWNLSGPTTITLTPESALPPLISAGELFGLFPLGRLTIARDVKALESIKRSILNPPIDWDGDPCFPHEYAWTGVTCSEGSLIRVITLNLSRMSLSGSLSPTIAKLTALTAISFADNNLTGSIPNISHLNLLEKLHLQGNQLTGTLPPTLGSLKNLRELFLQNNNLTGKVPENLIDKPELNLKLTPGNHFSPPSAA